MKRILDKKMEPTELCVRSSGSPLRGSGKFSPSHRYEEVGRSRCDFSSALSIASREREAAMAATTPSTPELPSLSAHRKSLLHLEKPTEMMISIQEGDYYVKPNMEILKSSDFDQLSSFKDLVVGRVGYEEIRFLEPIDLTGL